MEYELDDRQYYRSAIHNAILSGLSPEEIMMCNEFADDGEEFDKAVQDLCEAKDLLNKISARCPNG